MNGSTNSIMAGRVEVCIDNVYGAICNDRWDDQDAAVVCNQLHKGLNLLLLLLSLLLLLLLL